MTSLFRSCRKSQNWPSKKKKVASFCFLIWLNPGINSALKQVCTNIKAQILGYPIAVSRIKKRLCTFTLKFVERCCQQESVSHVRRSSATSDACKNREMKWNIWVTVIFKGIFIVICLRTGLLKTSLDPLREPAHFAVTVQGVSTKSPRETHQCSASSIESKSFMTQKQCMEWCSQVGQRGEVVEGSFWYGWKVITMESSAEQRERDLLNCGY